MSRRRFIGVSAVAGASFLSLALRDLNNLNRIFEYWGGKPVDCFKNVEPETLGYPFDAIAICGGGVSASPNGKAEPSPIHKLRLEAGAIAYIQKKAPNIILLDGKLDPNVDPEMDRKYLQKLVNNLSQDKVNLPKTKVIVDCVSVNTASNMEELKKIATNYGFEEILLITSFFHINGAELNACAYGINTYPQAAEDIITDFDPSRKQEILSFYDGQPMDVMHRKEQLRVVSEVFDPKGRLSILLKNK